MPTELFVTAHLDTQNDIYRVAVLDDETDGPVTRIHRFEPIERIEETFPIGARYLLTRIEDEN